MSKYYKNYKLSNLSWFKTGGPADIFFMPSNFDELQSFLQKPNLESEIFLYNNQVTILGAGSNILIHDNGISGIVIKLGHEFSNIKHDYEKKLLYIGSRCLNYSISQYCMREGIAGFEFLSSIPGTSGGGAFMNAGAYGLEYKNILCKQMFPLYAVKCLDFAGNIRYFTLQELDLQYRSSIFHKLKNYIIIEVVLQYDVLNLDLTDVIKLKIDTIKQTRHATQPILEKTCGSTFRNSDNLAAWQIVDLLQMRGFKHGGAMVSEKHSNFIINYNNATSQDIFELICIIKNRAQKELAINLETEICFLGF